MKLLILFLLRVYQKCVDGKVTDFLLKYQTQKVGFDDIELKYKCDREGEVERQWKIICFEAKHTQQEDLKLSITDFAGLSGDFSLIEYFLSYCVIAEKLENDETIDRLILITNRRLDEKAKVF